MKISLEKSCFPEFLCSLTLALQLAKSELIRRVRSGDVSESKSASVIE